MLLTSITFKFGLLPEIICHDLDPVPHAFNGFRRVEVQDSTLLGAPLFRGRSLDEALASRCTDLDRAAGRLSSLASHDALLIP